MSLNNINNENILDFFLESATQSESDEVNSTTIQNRKSRYYNDLWTPFIRAIYNEETPTITLENPTSLSKLPSEWSMRRMHPNNKGKYIDFHKNTVINSGFDPVNHKTEIDEAKLILAKEFKRLDKLAKSLKMDKED